MKNLRINTVCILFMLVVFSACELVEVDPVNDPNRPSSGVILTDASRGDLQFLVTGMESANRLYNNGRADLTSLLGDFGRESYYLNSSDPNFISVWLQFPDEERAEENNNFFVDPSVYDAPYSAVRQADFIIEAASNSEAISDQERNGYTGFAKTLKAFQLLIPLNAQFQNGIRVELNVTNALEPGPFLGYDEALAAIRAILDDGAQDLANAGEDFAFDLTGGFDGFDNPASMRQVNRGIAARSAVYAEEWQDALDALDESFLELSEGAEVMNTGPALTFDGAPGQNNPYFFQANAPSSNLLVVHPSLLDDAETGDLRVENKFSERDEPASDPVLEGVQANFQDGRFAEPKSDMPFIRNEELVLISAEANAQLTNFDDANDAINLIRNTWGLSDFNGSSTDEIIDQVLFERRYSLWGEAQRWIDARRYDRLDEIPTALDGGRVPTQFARPQGEIDFEDFLGN